MVTSEGQPTGDSEVALGVYRTKTDLSGTSQKHSLFRLLPQAVHCKVKQLGWAYNNNQQKIVFSIGTQASYTCVTECHGHPLLLSTNESSRDFNPDEPRTTCYVMLLYIYIQNTGLEPTIILLLCS